MHHIVFLERDSIRATVRRPAFPHTWTEYPSTRPEQMAERLASATIAITNKVRLGGDLLASLSRIELIAGAATGTDNIDVAWCRDHGIAVTNIRAYAVHAVPEHAMMLMLALRRQLLAYRADLAAGKWQQAPLFCFFDHPIRDLYGSTLAVFGGGALGRATAKLAQAFGMRVVYGERKGAPAVRDGYIAFDDALRSADVISLHCPLTAETRGMIGAAELRAMKPEALLINTGRGGLVDEGALAQALREGWIAGAGFDVLSVEPPREGNPLLAPDLLALPNFILTPHVGWASGEAMQTLADQLIDNIEAYVRGDSANRVV